jgi:hypothetical protein
MNVCYLPFTEEKTVFNRTLNASFLTRDNTLLRFLYRMIRHYIEYAGVSPEHKQFGLYAFKSQFESEFDFHPSDTDITLRKPFIFALEMANISDLLYNLELRHPILRMWNRDDPTVPFLPWARFEGQSWDEQHEDFVYSHREMYQRGMTGWTGGKNEDWMPEAEKQWKKRVHAAYFDMGFFRGAWDKSCILDVSNRVTMQRWAAFRESGRAG